jgi:membrane associated rhomboid family serine protease
MQAATIHIETRSKAQALDWSLVLISQGIESVLSRRDEDAVWLLEVAGPDEERARQSLAAYERENATTWKTELPGAGLLFDRRAALWWLVVALFYGWQSRAGIDLRGPGAVDAAAIPLGEWWRVITAVTLHADIAHLAANATIGFVFLGLAMGALGAGNALFLSVIAGAVGNVATFLVHAGEPFRSLGASGMVMGALGLIAAQSIALAQHERRAVLLGRGVMAACLLVVLIGFSPRSDVTAHVGGFVAGILLGAPAMAFHTRLCRRWVNAASFAATAALLGTAWWLALR